MGNSCTHAADAIAHAVTEEEIQKAVRGIEEWHKAQAHAARIGANAQNAHGPLLERVGGLDVVKKVVELFYKKLYSDSRLITFLYDQDIVHLRAKQSAFVTWLFGPPNMPYIGRSVRIAHLRIIKQRGFSPEDFDLGMAYFQEAMKELGAPDIIIGEVMRRMRPFRDAFFTPSGKDADEEARWAIEEQVKEEQDRKLLQQQQQQQELVAQEQTEHARGLQEQVTLARDAAGAAAAAAAATAAAAAAVASTGSLPASARSPTGRPQCPFTGARLSRPPSGAAANPAAAAAATTAAPGPALGPQCPFTGARSPRPSSRAGSEVAAAAAAAAAAPPPPSAIAAPVAVTARGGSGICESALPSGSRPPSAAVFNGTEAAVKGSLKRVASPRLVLPDTAGAGAATSGSESSSGGSSPTAVAAARASAVAGPFAPSSRPTSQQQQQQQQPNKRPANAAVGSDTVAGGGGRPAVSPVAGAAAKAPSPPPRISVPDPLSDFEAAMDAIEASASPASTRAPSATVSVRSPPRSPAAAAALLVPSLEAAASVRRTAEVCG